jgi:hypothetical protein
MIATYEVKNCSRNQQTFEIKARQTFKKYMQILVVNVMKYSCVIGGVYCWH